MKSNEEKICEGFSGNTKTPSMNHDWKGKDRTKGKELQSSEFESNSDQQEEVRKKKK